jgi:hypothetical protein
VDTAEDRGRGRDISSEYRAEGRRREGERETNLLDLLSVELLSALLDVHLRNRDRVRDTEEVRGGEGRGGEARRVVRTSSGMSSTRKAKSPMSEKMKYWKPMKIQSLPQGV